MPLELVEEIEKPPTWRDWVNRAAQGVSFGYADELASALEAAGQKITGSPQTLGDLYRQEHAARQESFGRTQGALGTMTELATAVPTGAVGASRALGTKGLQWITKLPAWQQAAILGGVEGGLYGSGTANPGERERGAAIGAITGVPSAAVGGWAGEKLGHAGIGLARWAYNKLSSTPRNDAIRMIRDALQKEGLDPDDAVRVYESLGSEGVMADVGENMRALLRAAVDHFGPAKAQARTALNARQRGMQGRLMSTIERVTGKSANDFLDTTQAIMAQRHERAKPLYDLAYRMPLQMTDTLEGIMKRPAVVQALKQAKAFAENYGDEFDPGSLKHLHYAKRALWSQISQGQRAGRDVGPLKAAHGALLEEMRRQNGTYARANEIWADDAALLDAADLGSKLMRKSPRELQQALKEMTDGERQMFKHGAVASIKDWLDTVPYNANAAERMQRRADMQQRLEAALGERESARLLRSIDSENAMSRTRAVVTGGSPTSQNLMGQKALGGGIQAESVGQFLMGDPTLAVAGEVLKVLQKKGVSDATLGELYQMLMSRGMSPEQIRKIMTSPRIMTAFPDLTVGTRAGAGILGPAMLPHDAYQK